ncbi:MAG TPA: glycosyltransferase family 39 protein [Verrucomicrobiae bacterium]|nr:glycosyltransferase family 39 protein [Verrucomicrobiae bacterium]
MAIILVAVSSQDSATVDETTFLGAGYTFWQGHRYYLVADHPPLDQMLASLPLLAMDIRLSDNAKALLGKQVGYPWTLSWACDIEPVASLFPKGRNNWYFWAMPEGQLFGQMFVYDGSNNGDALMLAARLTQVCLTLLLGGFVFWWARKLAGSKAAILALACYVANPMVLAYGHLIITDVAAMVTIPIGVFAAGRFVERPDRKTAIGAGAAIGCAFASKYTALTLGPIIIGLVVLYQAVQKPKWSHWETLLKNCGWAILVGWLVLLITYIPEWKIPPPINAEQASRLGVPHWFESLRWVLTPRDFFKGLAIGLAQAHHPRDAFLCGQWKLGGWWYYFPVALLLKLPIPLLILAAIALGWLCRQIRSQSFANLTPWMAASIYVLMGLTSKVDIGVRHMLPVCPLLAVCIATQWPALSKGWRLTAWVLASWLAVEALFAYPLYIQSFNEFVGGPQNGYEYLIDSNYDWGQDAKRLKVFLQKQGIDHIYLKYFGTQLNIEYLHIPNTRVDAEQARQIKQGWLVVSASELMRPEWAWLREQRQPFARVAYTLFVYRMD